jgi:hypothetical protein
LNAVIVKHRNLPSEYGVSDCYIIADDAVLAVTGERMFPDVEYTSELGAAKELLSRGFENVEQAFASKFEVIPVSMAQRGDIGVTVSDGQICGGFFTALGFACRDAKQLRFFPINRVKTAFKVG